MYDISGFYAAKSVADAVRALRENPDAVLISGGTDVLIKVREGKLAGKTLVSIHELPELIGVRMDTDGTIVLGPCTVFTALTADPIVRAHIPMLGEAVDQVGGPQIRNMGTIGGNIANGATSADAAPSLFALNAKLVLSSGRIVPIGEFYTGPGKTVREHDEIMTEIRIEKRDYENFGGFYIKYGKRASMEISTLGCASMVRLDGGKIAELRLAFGVAAPTPIRCPKTEALAAGQTVTPALLDALGKSVLEEVNPRTSWRASREFRLQLIEEMTKRATKQAICRAGGQELC